MSWNCSDGISSLLVTDLIGDQRLFDYIGRTYDRPGDYDFSCTVTSLDGSESQSISFRVAGVRIDEYDVLVENLSHRITGFVLRNDVVPMNVSFYVNDESAQSLAFGSREEILAFVEHNYSRDGVHSLEVVVNNSAYETSFDDVFVLQGVSVSDYDRVSSNGTHSLFLFEVTNRWYTGSVVTNFSELDLSLSSDLGTNESVLVFVEKHYSEGLQRPELVSYVDVYEERVSDVFGVRPLGIDRFLTLSEGSSSVSEVVVRNVFNRSQGFDFRLDSEDQEFADALVINSTELFVFVELNHSGEGVLESLVVVNTSAYQDNASGVIVR